jgi:HEAT repeat protein
VSANDYETMSVERLIEQFSAAARRFRAGRRMFDTMNALRAQKPPSTEPRDFPGRAEALAEVRELGQALGKRISLAQARGLMEEEDPDVRLCAAGQFCSMDMEWASATMNGLSAGLSTRDVLAARARARRPPPPRPTLKQMSDDALIARFEDAAERLGATRFLDCIDEPADQKAKNRVIDEGALILREVKSRDLLERLLPLLDSANDTVRFRAAQGCLRIATPQAVAVLEAIADEKNFDSSVSASDTLDYWRNGKALVDGL